VNTEIDQRQLTNASCSASTAGGAAVGGLTGAPIGMGIPEYEAKRYEGKVKDGNILMSVHPEDSKERDRAKKIFEDGGAEDISYTGWLLFPRNSSQPLIDKQQL
jgi:hypothetical protein